MKVKYSPRARDDLAAILSYIEGHSPGGARNVVRALHRTIELIGEFPECGRLAGEQSTRALPVGSYPYLIYWSVEAESVWVVHIRHTARRPWDPDQDRP